MLTYNLQYKFHIKKKPRQIQTFPPQSINFKDYFSTSQMDTRSGKRLVPTPLNQIKEEIRTCGTSKQKGDKNLPNHVINLGFSSLQQYNDFMDNDTKHSQKVEKSIVSYYPAQIQNIYPTNNLQKDQTKMQFDRFLQDQVDKNDKTSMVVDVSIKIDYAENDQNLEGSGKKQKDPRILYSVIQVKMEKDQEQLKLIQDEKLSKIIEQSLNEVHQRVRQFQMRQWFKQDASAYIRRNEKEIQKSIAKVYSDVSELVKKKYYP